jgi:hypothetical protein
LYILDFTHVRSNAPIGLKSDGGWIAPPDLVIRVRRVEFDVGGTAARSFGYALEGLSSIHIAGASQDVQFTGVVRASNGLYLSTDPDVQVNFRTLHLSGESASGSCDVTNAVLSDTTIPGTFQLIDNVSVSSQVQIAPGAFHANSLYLDESTSLVFDGPVPTPPATLIGVYNLTRRPGTRSGSQIVNDRNNSIYGEFNRTSLSPVRHICGRPFTTCEAWKTTLEAQVTTDDLRSGAKGQLSFYCGEDPESEYQVVWPEAGDYRGTSIQAKGQCLFAQVKSTDGDPTSLHYVGTTSSSGGDAPAAADSGTDGGTAAAIALGVILLLAIVGFVVFVVVVATGKLTFAGPDGGEAYA